MVKKIDQIKLGYVMRASRGKKKQKQNKKMKKTDVLIINT